MSDLIVYEKEGINKITEIQFGVLSTKDIGKLSVMECNNPMLYNEKSKIPYSYGSVDPHLGINQKDIKCPTCNNEMKDCPGHFGYIRLNFPIFHIGFFKKIIEILRCICKNCSRILIPEELKPNFRNTVSRIKQLSSSRKKNFLSEISKICGKIKICPHCGALNGKVKHIQGVTGPTIIVHEIAKKDIENMEEKNNEEKTYERKYGSAAIFYFQKNPSKLNANIKKEENIDIFCNSYYNSSNTTISIELTSPYVYNLFSHISPEDIAFFGMDGENSSPLDLLLQYVIIPPLSIRPTIQMGIGDTTTNEDDLTIKIAQMIQLNNSLKQFITEGKGETYRLMDDLNTLQIYHAYYTDSNTKGINKNILDKKEIKSLCTRLKGKKGRFRQNLNAKRVDFSGRTVISPDPNLCIDQLGIPVYMALNLTYPERVNEQNIKRLKKAIMNGANKHPGANYILINNGKIRIFLRDINREKVCNELKIGDIVERHIIDDDIILFNRQPSLHRVSIMALRAKILPWRTLRFNVSDCTPFNADFDGDEMNLHVPQTEEAKSEAYTLMNIIKNFQSPKKGEPLVASTQDFLLVCYLITQKDYFLDRTHFMRYCAFFNDAQEKVEIPPPTILKPKELWTGKQLFSVILKPNKNYNIIINLKTKSKSFSLIDNKNIDPFKCPKDGFVIIKNSQLLTGIIDKETIGNGSKKGLIFALIKDCGNLECAKFLLRISKFCSRWICDYGVSFGLGDVTPGKDLVEFKQIEIDKGFKKSDIEIEKYNKGEIELKPGLNMEQSLENNLNNILSKVRDNLGEKLRNNLPKTNTALRMASSGSKGNETNLCQMIGCLGQQIINGKRVPNSFINRSLPHFEEYSKYPSSKGFISHSFYNGLDSTEFFFHTIGGRENLAEQAVRTPESGYMQRRLMKALEDLTVQYNNTVTISNGEIIEFLYGDDGIEPISADTDDKTVYLPRLWDFICSKYPIKENNDRILDTYEIKKNVEKYIGDCPEKKIEIKEKFSKEVTDFFNEKIKIINESKKCFYNMKQNVINNICSIGEIQLEKFFEELWIKYLKVKVNPGEAVGAVAAQSLGEPTTQMTLKTFHFAGIGSMNITLGMPRITEIINNSKNISTPIIYANLVKDKDKIAAEIIKGRIEAIKLNRICKYIKEVISPEGCHIKIKLDKKYIDSCHLDISLQKIKDALLFNKKKLNLKLMENHIEIKKEKLILIIKPPETNRNNLYFALEILMKNLPEIIVSGVNTINRVVITENTRIKNKDDNKKEKEKKNDNKNNIKEKNKKKENGNEQKDNDQEKYYILTVEGKGLLEVLQTEGIDYKKTKSNNIGEILNVLGVEAARSSIIYELNYTYGSHGLHIDKRHLGLAADLMTFKGTVYGFQRSGMIKMKDSVFLQSSFERTKDILFEAATYGKVENLFGVSESIIVGKTIPIGTGIFKLFMDKKMFNESLNEKKNGMTIDGEFDNENDNDKDNGKNFAKNKVEFNLYDMIK